MPDCALTGRIVRILSKGCRVSRWEDAAGGENFNIESTMKTVEIISVAVCAAAMMSSCIDDKTLTQIQGSGIGALGGAAAGYFSGMSAEEIAVTSAIGAIAGFEWGDSVAKKKAGYIAKEDEIDADIKKLQERTEEVSEMNSYISKAISLLEATKSVTISQDQASKVSEVLAKGKKVVKSDLAAVETILQYANPQQRSLLKSEVSSLTAQLEQLTSSDAQLQKLIRA